MASKPAHVYLIAAARKVWYWSAQRREAIKRASVGPDLVRCSCCSKLMPKNAKRGKRKLYAVDHIDPVVPADKSFPQIPAITGSLSWDEYFDRLMFGKLQVLCHPCHKAKTAIENKARKVSRNERKRL